MIRRCIDSLGRIVIPKEMRKQLGMMEGHEVEIDLDGDMVVLRAINQEKEKPLAYGIQLIDQEIRATKGIDPRTHYGMMLVKELIEKEVYGE